MNNTKLNCSLNDTKELRNLILKNPTLPILIFCGEECWSGLWGYERADVSNIGIDELTLYNDEWIGKDEYRDKLFDELHDYKENETITDDEFEKLLNRQVREAGFVKAIIIKVG